MAQSTLTNGESGLYFRNALNTMFGELYTAVTNVLYSSTAGGQNITGGFSATAHDYGTTTAGQTLTPSQALGDYHTLTNNSAFTLAPPTLTAPANCASGVIEVYNGASAGAIVTSGWTKVSGSFTVTAGQWFQCDYCITPRGSFLNIRAMQ